jgi:hypothetical protein
MSNPTTQFYGTIEYLVGQHAAIVALTDGLGEWAGAGRIDLRPRAFETQQGLQSRLYEAGYIHASASAAAKGGRLETYKEEGV